MGKDNVIMICGSLENSKAKEMKTGLPKTFRNINNRGLIHYSPKKKNSRKEKRFFQKILGNLTTNDFFDL